MNRQVKRMQAKQERLAEKRPKQTAKQRAQQSQAQATRRVGVRGFGREVIAEMRKVLWPTRQQVINSFVIVVVVIVIVTAYVFGLDQAFQRLVQAIYG